MECGVAIFIGIILAVVALCIFGCSNGNIIGFVISALIGIVATIFIVTPCIVMSGKEPLVEMSDIPESVIKIYAIKDSSQTNGTIYFRRGYINEKEYIQFIVENSSGGKEIRKVRANNSSFYETDDNYRVETYVETTTYKLWFINDTMLEERYYKFYVPKNTITSEFEINLE